MTMTNHRCVALTIATQFGCLLSASALFVVKQPFIRISHTNRNHHCSRAAQPLLGSTQSSWSDNNHIIDDELEQKNREIEALHRREIMAALPYELEQKNQEIETLHTRATITTVHDDELEQKNREIEARHRREIMAALPNQVEQKNREMEKLHRRAIMTTTHDELEQKSLDIEALDNREIPFVHRSPLHQAPTAFNAILAADNISFKAESSDGQLRVVPGFQLVQNTKHLATSSHIIKRMQEIWETSPTAAITTIHGYSLRTWSLTSSCSSDNDKSNIEMVLLFLKTDGRPLKANVEVWQGPDHTPQKIQLYMDDGRLRPFIIVMETSPSSPHSVIAIQNTAAMEFPLSACIDVEVREIPVRNSSHRPFDNDMVGTVDSRQEGDAPVPLQQQLEGGSVVTWFYDVRVESVLLMLQSDGRPFYARVELLQGPNNIKQEMDVYKENGTDRPFSMIIPTPGNGSTLRIVNTGPLEYPLILLVEPHDYQVAVDKGFATTESKNLFTIS